MTTNDWRDFAASVGQLLLILATVGLLALVVELSCNTLMNGLMYGRFDPNYRIPLNYYCNKNIPAECITPIPTAVQR